jgi:hypothetical protein
MSKTRDTGYLANVIQVHDTGVRIMSGSTMLMAVSSSGAVTITGEMSGSDAANALLLDGTGSLAFTTTSSFLAVSSSQQQISASYIALSGSYNTFSGSASTRITENSSSIQQVSSSQQQISASLLNVISVFATTGSNSFRATQSITGSLTVTGQIVAQTLNVQQVTSSIVFSSGSNTFGCDLNSRQTFTGSMFVTGGLTVNTTGVEFQVTNNGVVLGNLLTDNHSVTGSLRVTGSITSANATFGTTASTVYGTLNVIQQCISAPSFVRGIELVHPNGTGATGGYIGISMTGQKQGTIQVGDDGATGNLLLQSQGGNVGIGVTPSASDTFPALQVGRAGFMGAGNEVNISANGYYSSPSWKYIATDTAALYNIAGNVHSWYTTVSGTANCAISWAERMRITNCGNVGIGIATPLSMLHVNCCVAGGASTTVARFGIQDSTGYGTTSPAIELTGTNIGVSFTMGKIAGINDVSSGGSMAFSTGLCAGTVVERMRITNCGRVGIGTTSPSTNFQVCGNISAENIAWIQNTNSCGYGSLRALNDINCAAVFGIGGSATSSPYTNTGYIYTDPNINFTFSIGSSEKMRILSTGNVCIFCQISAGPYVTIGNQGGTDTTVIGGGSGVGSLIRMNYAGGSYNNFLAGNGDNFFNCLLGKLNAAGGVKFGSGATTLNYYEAGTWTPQLYWSGGGYYCMGGGNGGNYVRVGNVVSVNYTLQWSGLCGSSGFGGQLRIGGLPFNVGSYRSAGTISAISSGIGRSVTGITWHANTVDPGANFIYWIENDPTGGYSHSPSVGASGLVYSNQVTYALQ